MIPDRKHELRVPCDPNAGWTWRGTAAKKRINPWDLFLECDASPYPFSPSEPSDFVYETDGQITVRSVGMSREVAGRFQVAYLDVEQAANESISAYDVFDSHQYTCDFYDAIFASGDGEANPRLLKLLKNDDYYVANVLIINRVELLAQFRGYAIGILAMRALIQRFSAGAAVVAIKPFPLQFESYKPEERDTWQAQLSLEEFSSNEHTATVRLRKHYSRLGFRKLPRTPFMFFSTAHSLPSVDDLVA